MVKSLHLVVDEEVVHEGQGVHDPAHRSREGPVLSLFVTLPSLMKIDVGPGPNRVGLAKGWNGYGKKRDGMGMVERMAGPKNTITPISTNQGKITADLLTIEHDRALVRCGQPQLPPHLGCTASIPDPSQCPDLINPKIKVETF
jgi:hypothetical protein